MKWMKTKGHIAEAVTHFNHAIEDLEIGRSVVEVSRCLFDAMNKIQTEWVISENDSEMGEIKAFKSMILKGLNTEDHINFLQSAEIRNFVFFEPQIMNHFTLKHHQYRPDHEIEPQLVKKASEEHHNVVNAYNTFLAAQKDEADDLLDYFLKKPELKERVIKRVSELLYVVRSNIAHGEKTPYGPDLMKKERDEEVCEVVIPLQRLLLNLLFDYPDRKLVAYGTLAPGNVNHGELSDIPGSWFDCLVNGRIDEINGLLFFDWMPSGPPIESRLFTSTMLPDSWYRLDKFEGSVYKRILIPVIGAIRSQGIFLANIYVAKHH